MPEKTRIVGLDVAKSKADACIRSAGRRLSASSAPEGQAELAAWLHAHRVGRAVMEASGGYERSWAEALRAAGLEVLVVDPKQVRCFAKAAGRLAKNDPIDAETIAWFAETFSDREAQTADPAREEVDRLVQARTALKDLEGRLAQQGEHGPPAIVAKALGAIAKAMRAELRKLDAAIAAKIKADPAFARRAEIIDSVPGLGDQAVAGLIAWAPELGRISNEAAAALIGAAPYDDDSGERKGVRRIKGGRRKLRNLLYMPVMGAATQHNPVLKAYYQRLRAKGKEAKVALIACMRKLIVILNTMLARDQTWNPPNSSRRMSEASRGRRAAHRADCMDAKKTGERTGSRPKPPKAAARSASLEPGRAPGYAELHSCFPSKARAKLAKECALALPPGVVARLAHGVNRKEADHGGGGDVIADPGDAAARLENLGERGGERGAENAAEIVGAGRPGVAHLRREQFGEQRPERREGQAHDAERGDEEGEDSGLALRQKRRHRKTDREGRGGRGKQHRAACRPGRPAPPKPASRRP